MALTPPPAAPPDADATVLGAAADSLGMPPDADTLNALPTGTRLHEFEILGVIGEGGFGIVYLAQDHVLGRRVALKEYLPASMALRPATSTEVRLRATRHADTFALGLRSFVNEARLLAQFDHPALLKVYRFWEAHGTAYMAMPYYAGRTLRAAYGEGATARPDEAWLRRLLGPLMDALETMHAARCYHRDVAPDNILLQAGDHPVLLDFGAARRVVGDATQDLTVILKSGYAPIEQYAQTPGVEQGPWTDVYALAAVLHFLLLGQPPPPAVARVVQDSARPLAETAAGLASPAFLQGIDRCLALWPADRPASMAAMREVLGLGMNPAARETGRVGMTAVEAAPMDGPAQASRLDATDADTLPADAMRQYPEALHAEAEPTSTRRDEPPRRIAPHQAQGPHAPPPTEALPSQARIALRGLAVAAGVLTAGLAATWAWRGMPAWDTASAKPAAATPSRLASSPLAAEAGATAASSATAGVPELAPSGPSAARRAEADASLLSGGPGVAPGAGPSQPLDAQALDAQAPDVSLSPRETGPAAPAPDISAGRALTPDVRPPASTAVDRAAPTSGPPPGLTAPPVRKRRSADAASPSPAPRRGATTGPDDAGTHDGNRAVASPSGPGATVAPTESQPTPADLEADRRKVRELNDKLDELLKAR